MKLFLKIGDSFIDRVVEEYIEEEDFTDAIVSNIKYEKNLPDITNFDHGDFYNILSLMTSIITPDNTDDINDAGVTSLYNMCVRYAVFILTTSHQVVSEIHITHINDMIDIEIRSSITLTKLENKPKPQLKLVK